ncbi:MAG: helix-turn-helix domain-containing protein [Pseudomonadota bacterium]
MSKKNTAAAHRSDMPALRDGDRHLNAAEVAEISGLSISTIRDYRSSRGRRYGPPFHKVERRVIYSLNEVLRWLDAQGARHG